METEGPLEFGRLSFEVPTKCPDVRALKAVVREELNFAFGRDADRASVCKSEHDRCQAVPAPFSSNRDAASYYQSAQMALSPSARQWASFEASVTDRFSDYSMDDGSSQEPAIEGWRLDRLTSTLRDKPRENTRAGSANSEAQIARQTEPGSWRERRPPTPTKSESKDRGRGK